MRFLAIIVLLFSITANAKCPKLTGSYLCEVTDKKGNPLQEYKVVITQNKIKANTEYQFNYSNGESLQIITDNTPRIKDTEDNGVFKRRRLAASCTREILMIDEENYLSKDKHFSDVISYYEGSSSYFKSGSGFIGLHDGILNYSENGQAKQKAVFERDSCQKI